MNHMWSRSTPMLAVATLLSLSVVQNLRQDPALASSPVSGPECTLQFEQTAGEQLFPLTTGLYVAQPLPLIGNVAACSLGMPAPYYSYACLELVQWDPVLLAPDPTTVALRTQFFTPSQLQYNHAKTVQVTPVVTRTIPLVAEPPRPGIAVQFHQTWSNTISVKYDLNGPSTYGTAQQVLTPSNVRSPMPGSHPVLSVGVCGGDPSTQELRVVQSVMTTNAVIDTSVYEIGQRFRVPAATTLRWVELAAQSGPYRVYRDLGNIAIIEGENLPALPAQLPPAMVQATMTTSWFRDINDNPRSTWFTHFAFDHTIALLPNHDYWLVARIDHNYSLLARALTGGEGEAFLSGIGPMVKRNAPGTAYTYIPDRALSFRLIGEPILPVDVLTTAPQGSALRLGCSPNPSRGPVLLSWSGAKGALEIDVLDARGRRVQHTRAETQGAGQWLFRGVDTDGRPLPAGLYFVRATDGAEQRALERVVLIR